MYRRLRVLSRFQQPADITNKQSTNQFFDFDADPDVDALIINRSAAVMQPELGVISLVGPLVRLSLPLSLLN